MGDKFLPHSGLDEMSKNILRKRYFTKNEKKWKQVPQRVVDYVAGNWEEKQREELFSMIYNRYFIPNSPTLVNAGKTKNAGLSACYVVPFGDTIEDIIEAKGNFFYIARKGGGCGTTLSDLRPAGEIVNGSTHGYAGGPVAFANTISHDMDAITQSGFRAMALMFTMSVYHPDIMKFIKAKEEEGKISNANISVVVDDAFMEKVKNDEEYQTFFILKPNTNKEEVIHGETYRAKYIFDQIVEGAWKNGEPGLLFDDRINDSPYKYAKVKIKATNPCGEQPLPPYGSCNLGSIDVSKFFRNGKFDWELFDKSIRLSVRFLDSVIDANSFPTESIKDVSLKSRQIGLGQMGIANLLMSKEMAYGSDDALEYLEEIFRNMYLIAKDESEIMGRELGVPEWCRNLPEPRRNITLISYAPTGTISILAGCNSGIEPFFSNLTKRMDETGTYDIEIPDSDKDYFRCAVSMNGQTEVTWQEHIKTQSIAQKWSDSGVSKTINFPNGTHRETIAKAFMLAYELDCKGITVYRNGSRNKEVLSPKNVNKNKCPICGEETIRESGCTKCSKCDWSLCTVG